MNSTHWILLQFADSALPVGGFVASGGLEVCVQISKTKEIHPFLTEYIHNLCYSTMPIIENTLDILCNNRIDRLSKLTEIDAEYNSFVSTNHVNQRASVTQGIAYLTLLSNSFKQCRDIDLVNNFKAGVRAKRINGHLPICFAIACHCLSIPRQEASELYLFLNVRTVVSTAIRLGICGPYQGQSIIYSSQCMVSEILDGYNQIRFDEFEMIGNPNATKNTILTSPILDILQASHDKLYTRIFNS